MSKKSKKSRQVVVSHVQQAPATTHTAIPQLQSDSNNRSGLWSFKAQAIIVAILAIVLYANTWKHEFALDDTIVIVKNEYVAEGFRGLKDIMTKDAFDSYYRQSNSGNQLAGGRYRPLSIATFAIEQQLLGTDSVDGKANPSFEMNSYADRKLAYDMHIRHIVNTLLYALSMVILLIFLRNIVFREKPFIAFIATLIFTVHPLHTEVVANVKSRDEILSLLFICLTFITAFRYRADKKTTTLLLSLGCYLLAFLSKEYAIATILLLPLSFMLFDKSSFGDSIKTTLPYLIVIGIYGLLRLRVITPANPDSDADIINNPYAFATPVEKIATEIATSFNYLKLLVFPHPLSSDYSYNTIPYKTFTHPLVLLSIIAHIAIVAGIVYTYKRNKTLCFGLAFYLLHLLLVNNFFFNIGATMGERLAYHSSIGFAIIVAYLFYTIAEKAGNEKTAAMLSTVVTGIVVIIFGYLTITRNPAWKNDSSLFLTDIKTSPNSALVNSNVGFHYLHQAETATDTVKKKQLAREALVYYNKALLVHPRFVSAFQNRALAYFFLDQADSARYNAEKVIELYPDYANIYELYYNIGVNFYMHKRLPEAIAVWQKIVQIKPDYALARQNIAIATAELQQTH